MLGIQHPEGKDETDWSAFDIADGIFVIICRIYYKHFAIHNPIYAILP